MALKYNGLPNTERMAVIALVARMALEAQKETPAAPESVLREIVSEAKLSEMNIVDQKKVLTAFYGRR